LYVELHAYGCQVFLDIKEVEDGPSGQLRRLAEQLNGAGVPSISGALRDMHLQPLHDAVRGLAEKGSLRRVAQMGAARAVAACPAGAAKGVDLGLRGPAAAPPPKLKAGGAAGGGVAIALDDATPDELSGLLDDAEARLLAALHALVDVTGAAGDVESAAAGFRRDVEAALYLPDAGRYSLCAGLVDEWTWVALLGRFVSDALAAVADPEGGTGASLEELPLGPVLVSVFSDLGLDEDSAWRLLALIRMLRHLPLPSSVAGLASADRAPALVRALIADETVRPYIRVNVWEGVSWFNREAFAHVLWWILALDALDAVSDPSLKKAHLAARLFEAERLTMALALAAETSGYQLDKLEDAAAEAKV
jgi:hypothetical protein